MGPTPTFASNADTGFLITGRLIDSQGQPIIAADVIAYVTSEEESIAETESQEDGSWVLKLEQLPEEVTVRNHRYHFAYQEIEINAVHGPQGNLVDL